MLIAEYTEFIRPLYFTQPHVWVFLTLFLFFTLFGILNELMGIIMDNMMQASEDLKKEEILFGDEDKLNALIEVRRLFHTMDNDNSGTVSLDELMSAVQHETVREALEQLHL